MSDPVTIECPDCKRHFPLSGSVLSSVREELTEKLQGDVKRRENDLASGQQELQEARKELERKTAETDRKIESEVAARLAAQLEEVRNTEARKAAEKNSTTLQDLQKELDEKQEALKEAQENELKIRSERRKLEDDKKQMALKTARTLDEERKKIWDDAHTAAKEGEKLTLAEKDKTIADLTEKMEEAQRRAKQGSQQLQGDVLEVDLENKLRASFPTDVIEPIAAGSRGADVIQKVFTRTGRECGSILYETKRTKSWQPKWLAKMKGDVQAARADIGIIVSETLPKELTDSFGLQDGLWVTTPSCAIPLALALRASLEAVALARGYQNGAKEKMEILYNYLTGNEFRQRVEILAETFNSMHEDLRKERSSTTTRWNKREKQIHIVIDGMAGMVGDVQALSGDAIGSIPALEMEDGDETAATEENEDAA